MTTESDLHRAIYARSADLKRRFPHILLGPGDDCAALGPDPRPLLVTTDQLIESRHFLAFPRTSIDLIARKAIARSVSDLAAMGAEPSWCVAAGVLPRNWEFADELCARLAHWGAHFGAPIVGGDIATYGETAKFGANPLILTTTVGGHAFGSRGPVLRSGARVGDHVYITGRVGNSFSSGRHLTFEPRVHEERALCEALGNSLHAMIDVSDGVGRDAGRIAESSGVTVEIAVGSVPLHDDVPPGADARHAALSDGEDYELLFTVDGAAHVPDTVAGRDGARTSVTRIGSVVARGGMLCVGLLPGDRRMDLSAAGWEHQ